MKVHVRAPFRLIRAVALLKRIKADPGDPPQYRSIINVSSITGLHGSVGWANYAVAKIYRYRMGFTRTRRARQRYRIWVHLYGEHIFPLPHLRHSFSEASPADLIVDSLTAAKEYGVALSRSVVRRLPSEIQAQKHRQLRAAPT